MKTQKTEKSEYQNNPTFWTDRTGWSVMGDFLGRIPSLEILKPQPGEVIVDAGSGEGRLTRMIAETGARVYGVERDEHMITKAREREESEGSLGVTYVQGDIAEKLPYENEFADAVFCVAVLIHDWPEECLSFFKEAYRILKPGGRIVISIMHAYLYQPGSPNRTGRASWAQYEEVDNLPMDRSQRFRELYHDKQDRIFDSIVWYHPEHILPRLLQEAGLNVIYRRDNYVTAEALKAINQTGEVGYPAFYQLLAKKG